jgi:hypothetical protein
LTEKRERTCPSRFFFLLPKNCFLIFFAYIRKFIKINRAKMHAKIINVIDICSQVSLPKRSLAQSSTSSLFS